MEAGQRLTQGNEVQDLLSCKDNHPAVFDRSLKATVLTCPALNRRQPKQCNKRHCGSEHIWHRHGGREEEEHKEKEKKETERRATSGRAGNLGFSSRSECKV
ncbi:hypothetical protein R3I94_022119 [Phoxinus phoxinus]|uniref:Uncharacterized protein n=1 Tax=Phoxinus phoxinus TaxID=58324 RepID=A0AAN9C6M9_9TELE